MEHDEPGRRPGRPRPGAVPRGGDRQPPPRRNARRAGAPRRTPPARGGRPDGRTRRGPQDEAGYPPQADDAAAAFAAPPPRGVQDGPDEGRGGRPPAPGRRPKGRGRAPGQGAKPARTTGRAAKTPKPPKARGRAPGDGAAGAAGRSGPPGPRLYFGAAAGLGVVVLAVVVLVAVLSGPDGGKTPPGRAMQGAAMGRPAASGPSPASYSSSPSTSAYKPIERRDADAAPLTAGELFPSSAKTISIPDGDVKAALRAKRLEGDCAAAVWGGDAGAALRRGGCTQAARSVHADTGKGYALSVTVFNLASSADADRLVEALGRGGGFVRPLPGEAPLDRFGQGYGMARGLAMGHYAVVSWAQRLDGEGDGRDETLLSLLIEGGKCPGVLGRAARVTG